MYIYMLPPDRQYEVYEELEDTKKSNQNP